MFNKKLLVGFVAFSLLPMFSASAMVAMDDDSDSDMIYLRLGYQATFVGSNKIDAAKATSVLFQSAGYTITVDPNKDYVPKYAINFLGGSLGIGKSFGGEARAELELAATSKIEIDNKNEFEYFNNIAAQTDENAFINKGFSFGVASLNLYYDLDSGKPGLTPYIGGGLGVARVNFMSSPDSEVITYPIALQFKAGLQMNMNDVMPVYLGYKLVYLLAKESGAIQPILTKPPATIAGPSYAKNTKIKPTYMLHNIDFGFTIVR